jgi:hypothetical protein
MSGNCGEVLGNWCDTLERRPAESVAATQPKSDGDDWFERGELPPVGVACSACILAKKSWVDIEVVAHRDGFAIGWCNGEMCVYHSDKPYDFFPIKTERQRTITGMVDIMIGTPVNDNLTATERLTAVASAIYDKFISKQGGEV